jgi:hypothetical protein
MLLVGLKQCSGHYGGSGSAAEISMPADWEIRICHTAIEITNW